MGGRLVYSTCSFNPIENEAVVANILQKCEGKYLVKIWKSYITFRIYFNQNVCQICIHVCMSEAIFVKYNYAFFNRNCGIIRRIRQAPWSSAQSRFNEVEGLYIFSCLANNIDNTFQYSDWPKNVGDFSGWHSEDTVFLQNEILWEKSHGAFSTLRILGYILDLHPDCLNVVMKTFPTLRNQKAFSYINPWLTCLIAMFVVIVVEYLRFFSVL